MNRKMLLLNFKSYLGIRQSVETAGFISRALKGGNFKGYDIVIAPPTIAITEVKKVLEEQDIELCTQNIDIEGKGAYTGSISADSIVESGCVYSLIGHSETRNRKAPSNGDTDELIKAKIGVCLDSGIKPILCIGETFEQRKNDETKEIIHKQLSSLTKCLLERRETKSMCIAYEPVCAISSTQKRKPEPKDMYEAIDFIKDELAHKTVLERKSINVLYGGSVDSGNITGYLQNKNIDGVLVGSASTKKEELKKIIDILGNNY